MSKGAIVDIIKDDRYDKNWELEIAQLPDIDQYKANLTELWELDKTGLDQEAIRQLFFEKAVLLPNESRATTPEVFNSLSLWRVRTHVGPNEDIRDTATFSYPPFCNENGRGNLKTQPVFYGSLSAVTALFEVKPQAGDILYLSRWDPSVDRKVDMQLLLPESLPEQNGLFEFYQRQKYELTQTAHLYGREKGKHLESLVHFLRTVFVEESAPYPLSSWLSHNILFGSNSVDVLLYPSVTAALSKCNVAIRPDFVDRYLSANFVYQLQINALNPPQMNVALLATAKKVNKTFEWREPNEEDKLRFSEELLTTKFSGA